MWELYKLDNWNSQKYFIYLQKLNFKKMQKITIKLAALLIIASFLYACGGEEPNEEQVEETTEEVTEENMEMTEQVDYVLPSPLQIAELFKSAGLTYIGDLANKTENAENLSDKKAQKLNFGIYSADMAYCIMNNQTQESINYLNTLRKLSEKMWMTDVFNSLGLSERLEANVGNEDSLTYIMADLQMQMDDYLEENGMGSTGYIIFAGAWVETMYLGVKVNENERNERLISRLSEQAVILNSVIKAIKQTDEDGDYADLIADLEGINKHFASFNEDSEEEYMLTDEEITALAADVTTLRTKLIGG